MNLLATATALLPTITGLLDKLIPEPETKARAQLDLLKPQRRARSRSWRRPCSSTWPR